MSDSDRKHLQVVAEPAEDPRRGAREQLVLPFHDDMFVLVIAHLTNVSEQSFMWLLSETKPDAVIDLRLVPRFNFGRLNRKVVFRLFTDMSSRSHDLSHDLGISGRHDASLNPAVFADPLDAIVSRSPRAHRVLIFVDDAALLDRSLEVLPGRMSAPPKGSWSIRGLARDHLEARCAAR